MEVWRKNSNMNNIIHPLKPIYNSESKILILGSFPSVISREKRMYYANPQNRFWKVLSILFQEEIEDKEAFCLEHHIALWDVIQSCEIIGSNDSSIKNVLFNPIEELIEKTKIKVIITNGNKAKELFLKHFDLSLPFYSLPSTSSANATYSLEKLCNHYKIIQEYCGEEN